MSRNIAPFGVRMPSELKDKVEEAARASGRSMNAEIVHRLQQSFAGGAGVPENLLDQIIANKGGKPLDPESIDPEDIAQALVWVGEVQRSLITRMLNATKAKIDEQP
ncbi:Arc family DNA-binding protein [Oceanisphaera sp. KMM 10153]|uniref:Arc family DNA-binding protein n=1 Tax=Oceanisphaera submarina TaxID=3390193 RepID=UPI003975315C